MVLSFFSFLIYVYFLIIFFLKLKLYLIWIFSLNHIHAIRIIYTCWIYLDYRHGWRVGPTGWRVGPAGWRVGPAGWRVSPAGWRVFRHNQNFLRKIWIFINVCKIRLNTYIFINIFQTTKDMEKISPYFVFKFP